MRAAAIVMLGMLGLVACASNLNTVEDIAPPNADPLGGCAISCHGDDVSNAPPKSVAGATDTTVRAVGAHRAHLVASPSWHQPIQCGDCHVVPETVDAPGHIDGDNIAEVIFSARAGGTASTWNGTTCTAACHGKPEWGGKNPTPTWTRVDGTQSVCGSCHGAPPPAPHPAGNNCAMCHPTMEENSLNFRDPSSHINGKIDVVDPSQTGGCTTCHGSDNAAPPKDLAGNTAATSPRVGAHQAHLKTQTSYHAVVCSSCHIVPQTVDSPGHRDGDNIAEVIFDKLNPMGVYTRANTTCSTMYCHGNGRGSNGTISFVAQGPLACNACHATNGTNMSGQHAKHIQEEHMKCNACHRDVVDQNMVIIKADLHVNGVHEVRMAQGIWDQGKQTCSATGCHQTLRWTSSGE